MMGEGLRLAVRAWSAWAPQRETPAAWRAWAGVPDIARDEADDGAIAVPMMLRRRSTALGQKMLASALACGETASTGRYVLASRHGEFSRTLGILKSLAAHELPSPADFSMSVHNGLAGLLSIHLGNTRGHTAMAAGLDTFGFGLMEAAARLAEQPNEPVLLLFGDEPLPGEFDIFGEDDIELPLVVALALQAPAAGDDGISFHAVPSGSGGARPSTAAPIDFLRFLLSGAPSAVSEGARMTWTWRRDA
jgi:Beta-ketoacyl synthase, N-terminal domain